MKVCLKYIGFFFLFSLLSCGSTEENYDNMCKVIKYAENTYQHPGGEQFDTASDSLQLLPELIKASAFFASKKDFTNAAQASLYTGYAQKEAGDKASAMKSFKDAGYYGSLTSDSLTIARAQYNIAKLFMDDYAYDDLLAVAEQSVKNFGNHYDECAFVLNLMASSYILQKDYVNAELCLKRALDFAEKGDSKRAKRKVLNNYSVMYREKGDYKLAIDYIRQSKAVADSNDIVQVDLNIGKIYI